MRTLSASWKRASSTNASTKMERQRAVDQLRTITAANNEEEKKISNTIAKAALVDRSVALIEAKITAAKTSIQENSEQEVIMNNHWSSIGDEMKKMLNNWYIDTCTFFVLFCVCIKLIYTSLVRVRVCVYLHFFFRRLRTCCVLLYDRNPGPRPCSGEPHELCCAAIWNNSPPPALIILLSTSRIIDALDSDRLPLKMGAGTTTVCVDVTGPNASLRALFKKKLPFDRASRGNSGSTSGPRLSSPK